jgi:hypothetical protein
VTVLGRIRSFVTVKAMGNATPRFQGFQRFQRF